MVRSYILLQHIITNYCTTIAGSTNNTVSQLISEIRNAPKNCELKDKKVEELKKVITKQVEADRHFNRQAPGFYAKICSFRPDLLQTSFPKIFKLKGRTSTNQNLTVVPVETEEEKRYRESNEEYERLNRLW